MKSLSRQVRDARELLDFAVSEGFAIDDDVIKVIHETADQVLRSDASATTAECSVEQRIVFVKAYNKLVDSLDSITADSLFFSFKAMNYLWYGLFAVFAVVATIKVAFLTPLPESLQGTVFDVSTRLLILVGLVVLFVLWFINVFTGVLTKRRAIEMLIFCYSFTVFSVVILVTPFFLGDQNVDLYNSMRHGPIGVLNGCSAASGESWSTQELSCGDQGGSGSSQWVLNIGGSVRSPAGSEVAGGATEQALGPTEKSYEIHGGLVIPIYVIFLALLGGIVSMTRRVPEYQRLAHLGKNDPEFFSRDRVREMLVFQLMQVISAPLIAITAYYMINPTGMTTSVVISFGAGFASETILMAIRTAVDRLNASMQRAVTAKPGATPPPAGGAQGDGGNA